MSLALATDGPCIGHACDHCRRCAAGRCCRTDNPGYQLPETGDWDGPIHGRIGVLEDDGSAVTCHACGQSFRSLAHHAWLSHNLTGAEYRALFGLKAGRTLMTEALTEKKRSPEILALLARMRPEAVKISQEVFTPEQRSVLGRGRKVRLESKLNPRWMEAHREGSLKAGPKISAARKAEPGLAARLQGYNEQRAGPLEKQCIICGASFPSRNRQRVVTCGDLCDRERRRQAVIGDRNPAKNPKVARKIAASKVRHGRFSTHFPEGAGDRETD